MAGVCGDCFLQRIQASLVVVSPACDDGFVAEFSDVRCDDGCSGGCVYGAPIGV